VDDPMSESFDLPSHLQIASAAMGVFANDGTIDRRELEYLVALALRDGEVDEDEKRVLAGIFDRVPRREVSPELWKRIGEVRAQHGI
jgi:hypothetical protein